MIDWVKDVRERLARDFGSKPWLCVMATVDTDGHPTARCMICREIDSTGRLVFVSDRRSRKDDHLRACPSTEVCFWLNNEQSQIRIRGDAMVIDAEADTFMREVWWDRIPQENRDIVTSSEETDDNDPPMPQTFELIVVVPTEVELQELNVHPHRKQVWKFSRTWEALSV